MNRARWIALSLVAGALLSAPASAQKVHVAKRPVSQRLSKLVKRPVVVKNTAVKNHAIPAKALDAGAIFLYDKKCPLCRLVSKNVMRTEGLLSRFSKRIRHNRTDRVTLYTEDLYRIFPGLDRKACEADLHLIEKVGKDRWRVQKGHEMVQYFAANYGLPLKLIYSKPGEKLAKAYYNTMHRLRNAIKHQIEGR